MKREWDIIREVLLEVEALTEGDRHQFDYSPDQEEDPQRRAYGEHAILLWKGRFIEAIDASTSDGRSIMAPDLTWQGHELLDTLRSKPVWERVKGIAREKGLELTFDVVKGLSKLAIEWVLKQGDA